MRIEKNQVLLFLEDSNYPSYLDKPYQLQQASPYENIQPKKKEKEQDFSFLIPSIQVNNFEVYTNPLSYEKVKDEILYLGGFLLKSQLTPYTPLTSRIPFH